MPQPNLPQYQAGQEIVPGYTLVQTLGQGMAGDVWVARAAGGLDVAVKVVRSLSVLGGRKELKALKTIRNVRHPNLCPVHGFWTKDEYGRLLEDGEMEAIAPDSAEGDVVTDEQIDLMATMQIPAMEPDVEEEPKPSAEQLIVVMGLGDCTLFDRLQEFRASAGIPSDDNHVACGLSAEETVGYLRAAAGAIDELNQKHDIYHCDIKPQNILLVGGGAQVCDFGLADRIEGDTRKTQHAFASPAYAAPEVLQGQTYSRAVDQYSLAVTYFELRTGLLPFDSTTEATVLLAKCSGKLELSHVSSAERKVLQRAMSVDPGRRYSSCTEFMNAMAVASRVDSSGGVGILKTAGVVTGLVTAVVLGLVTWAAIHPESYKTWISPLISSSDIPEDVAARIAKCGQTVDAFSEFELQESQSYGPALKELRTALENLVDLSPQARDEQRFELAGHSHQASQVLAKAALAHIDLGIETDEGSRWLDIDVELLKRSNSILRDNDWSASDVRARELEVELIRALADLRQGGLASEAVVMDLRAALERHKFVEPRMESLAAFCIASSHSGMSNSILTKQQVTDFSRFEQDLEQDSSLLPEWCLSQWIALKAEFHPDKLSATYEKSLDLALKESISNTWPEISDDAQRMELLTLARSEKWSEFVREFQKYEHAESGSTTETWKLMAIMARSIESVESTGSPKPAKNAFQSFAAILRKNEKLKMDFDSLIEPWIRKLTSGIAVWPTAQDEMLSLREAGLDLMGILAGKRDTSDLDQVVLENALALGPSSYAHPELNVIRNQIGRSEIGNLIAIEEKASRGLRDQSTARKYMSQSDSTPLLPKRLHGVPGLEEYLSGLIRWHLRRDDDAAITWSALVGTKAVEPSNHQLDRARRDLVATTLLKLAKNESGVDDEDISRRRYEEIARNNKLEHTREHIEDARPWLQGVSSGTAWESLVTELLLCKMADTARRKESFSDLEIPNLWMDRLDELLRQPDNPGPSAFTNQQYRAAFDIALDRAEGGSDPESLGRAVQLANLILGRHSNSKTIELVLNPVMKTIRLYTSRDANNLGWKKFEGLDRKYEAELRKFCTRYNKEAGLYDSESDELAAAMLGAMATEEENAWEYWLQAAQKLIEIRNPDWDSEHLRYLRKYIENAENSAQDGNPMVAVQKALLLAFEARSELNEEKRIELFSKAVRELSDAIDHVRSSALESDIDPRKYYFVLCLHADQLVSLAFQRPPGIDPRELLLKAKESANEALGIVQNNEKAWLTPSDAYINVYLTIGNCSEDLAHYCSARRSQEQREFFEEALAAFESAKDRYVEDISRADPVRAIMALARCRYRYGIAFSSEEKLRISLLEMEDIETRPSGTTIHTWIEFLIWRAKIRHDLDRFSEAVVDTQAAYDLLQDVHDLQQQNEVRRLHAILLYKSRKSASDVRNAVELLREIESPSLLTYWMARRWEALFLFELRDDELRRFAIKIPEERFTDIGRDPLLVTESVLAISIILRNRVAPELFGSKPRMDVKAFFQNIEGAFSSYEEKQRDEVSQLSGKVRSHLESIRAIEYSIFSNENSEPGIGTDANSDDETTTLFGKRVMRLATASRNAEDAGIDSEIVDELRRALCAQFIQVFAAEAWDQIRFSVVDLDFLIAEWPQVIQTFKGTPDAKGTEFVYTVLKSKRKSEK